MNPNRLPPRATATADFRGCFSALVLLLGGCMASTNKPRAEIPPATRIPDSVAEKSAAQRSASGGLQLEAEDQRWGIEAAKERKRRTDAARDSRKVSDPTKMPTGPVDIKAP